MSDSIVMIRSSSPHELQRAAEAGVEGAAGTLVLDLLEDLERQPATLGAGDLDRAVRRAVVDENDRSPVAPQLRARSQVPHEIRDVRLLIEGGNNDDGH